MGYETQHIDDLYVNFQIFVLQCCIKFMNFVINFVGNFYFFPLYNKNRFGVNEFNYILQVVLTSLLHYGTFVFIIICYLMLSLAIFHSCRGAILIKLIKIKQGIMQYSLDIV